MISSKNRRKIRIKAAVALLVFMVIAGACAVYVSDYYRADVEAIESFEPMDSVTAETPEAGITVFKSDQAAAGFIFYPGGKVEAAAYQPLMAACAQRGIICILVEMPFNLAVLDVNAADGIQTRYPEVQNWYIGGHSLGGSMAAAYLADHMAEYEGLVLLGAYSTADLSGTDLEVLSVYGSEDQVMNRDKYSKYRPNLPEGFGEVILEGGCHAYFGMYGLQTGDGDPAISNEEQILLTADAIYKMMNP